MAYPRKYATRQERERAKYERKLSRLGRAPLRPPRFLRQARATANLDTDPDVVRYREARAVRSR